MFDTSNNDGIWFASFVKAWEKNIDSGTVRTPVQEVKNTASSGAPRPDSTGPPPRHHGRKLQPTQLRMHFLQPPPEKICPNVVFRERGTHFVNRQQRCYLRPSLKVDPYGTHKIRNSPARRCLFRTVVAAQTARSARRLRARGHRGFGGHRRRRNYRGGARRRLGGIRSALVGAAELSGKGPIRHLSDRPLHRHKR